MGATQNSLRGLQTSRPHLLIELHPRLGVSIQVPRLSFTSLHMCKPYSNHIQFEYLLFQIILIINLPYLINY